MHHSNANQWRNPVVALVADELTFKCISPECQVVDVSPINRYWRLRRSRPDLLLVESAWQGNDFSWKHKIAKYPKIPWRSNRSLRGLVTAARDLGIPTVFWNKEDGVHFDRFIDSAKLFDHVFTVDENCVERYRAVMGPDASVHTLPFPVQPAHHHFTGFNFKHHRANFLGSYSRHIHAQRQVWQDSVFRSALDTGLGLTVFDRNSGRKSGIYRYPDWPGLEVLPAVSHEATAAVYRDYLVSLNVNTVIDSPTMYSRRLVEILACGGIAVTSPARSVDLLFKDYCHVVADAEQADELFARLRHGPSAQDLERARAGSECVLRDHTWARRLEQIARVVGL